MRIASYERIEPQAPTALPMALVQTCGQRRAAVWLALTVPLVLGAAFASVMLIVEAVSLPAARDELVRRPALALEVLAAIAFWLYLLVLPIRRQFHKLTATRTVAIDPHTVTVTENGYFRRTTWMAPLHSYAGVAHHLRASVSGTRHELILVHPDKAKSVLLSIAENVSESEVERVATLLRQKVISSSELYRFKVRWPRLALPRWHQAATASALIART